MSKTILVVDDEPGYRALLDMELSGKLYKVLTAEGGVQALEILEREKVDLVITDMKMPNMDGLDLLMAGRRLHPDIPFIIITGYANEERLEQALSLKASSCLYKPFRMEELCVAVQDAVASV